MEAQAQKASCGSLPAATKEEQQERLARMSSEMKRIFEGMSPADQREFLALDRYTYSMVRSVLVGGDADTLSEALDGLQTVGGWPAK